MPQTAAALAASFAICKGATWLTKLFGIEGGNLPVITAMVVFLATVLPKHFGYLAPGGDAIAVVLMQVIEISALQLICITWIETFSFYIYMILPFYHFNEEPEHR